MGELAFVHCIFIGSFRGRCLVAVSWAISMSFRFSSLPPEDAHFLRKLILCSPRASDSIDDIFWVSLFALAFVRFVPIVVHSISLVVAATIAVPSLHVAVSAYDPCNSPWNRRTFCLHLSVAWCLSLSHWLWCSCSTNFYPHRQIRHYWFVHFRIRHPDARLFHHIFLLWTLFSTDFYKIQLNSHPYSQSPLPPRPSPHHNLYRSYSSRRLVLIIGQLVSCRGSSDYFPNSLVTFYFWIYASSLVHVLRRLIAMAHPHSPFVGPHSAWFVRHLWLFWLNLPSPASTFRPTHSKLAIYRWFDDFAIRLSSSYRHWQSGHHQLNSTDVDAFHSIYRAPRKVSSPFLHKIECSLITNMKQLIAEHKCVAYCMRCRRYARCDDLEKHFRNSFWSRLVRNRMV